MYPRWLVKQSPHMPWALARLDSAKPMMQDKAPASPPFNGVAYVPLKAANAAHLSQGCGTRRLCGAPGGSQCPGQARA